VLFVYDNLCSNQLEIRPEVDDGASETLLALIFPKAGNLFRSSTNYTPASASARETNRGNVFNGAFSRNDPERRLNFSHRLNRAFGAR
jgi:hypothetical protein